MKITQSRLKSRLKLNEDGDFIGIVPGSKNFGRRAGYIRDKKIILQIDGKLYAKDDLVCLYKTGEMPEKRDYIEERLTREVKARIEKEYYLFMKNIITTSIVAAS